MDMFDYLDWLDEEYGLFSTEGSDFLQSCSQNVEQRRCQIGKITLKRP